MPRRIRYYDQNGKMVIATVTEDGEEEEVSVNPVIDSINITKEITEEELTMAIKIELPHKASNNTKGKIGEEVCKEITALLHGALIENAEDRSYDFKALGFTHTKIDAKFSSPLNFSGRADGPLEWEFGLASNGKKKDYTKSCDALLCVGLKPNGGIEAFLVPSSSEEAINNDKFTIPVNWENSKYAKYHIELNRPTNDLERWLLDGRIVGNVMMWMAKSELNCEC